MAERYAAIVTGGAAGIGLAICRRLLDQGYDVIALDRQQPKEALPGLKTIAVDLFDAAATEQAAAEAARLLPVSHVIHNAGVIFPNLLAEVKRDDLMKLAQLHLGAALALVQAALPGMQQRRFGRIVLISTRAVLGLATRTSYSATKAGMLGMSRTWSLELAPHGITSNVICPGPIQTDQFHAVIPRDDPKVPQIAASIPVKRLGQPEDVANAVAFFCAPEAGFVTGQTLYVCGGTSVGSLTL